MSEVQLVDVVKRYGKLVALDGLSLAVPKGSACAVIGPNGSGKTTMFSVIAGLLATNSGRVELFGEGPFDARRHAGRVGLMPQDAAPSPHATPSDQSGAIDPDAFTCRTAKVATPTMDVTKVLAREAGATTLTAMPDPTRIGPRIDPPPIP